LSKFAVLPTVDDTTTALPFATPGFAGITTSQD
jgi:hypothetical protein